MIKNPVSHKDVFNAKISSYSKIKLKDNRDVAGAEFKSLELAATFGA